VTEDDSIECDIPKIQVFAVIMAIFMVFALILLTAGVGVARRCRSRA
jgi:hypothetical protein